MVLPQQSLCALFFLWKVGWSFFVLCSVRYNFPKFFKDLVEWRACETLKGIAWYGFLLLSFPPNKTHPSVDWMAMDSWSFPVLISLYKCNCGKSTPIKIAASLSSVEEKSVSHICWTFKSSMPIFCFGNLKLSTTHTLLILNGSGCQGDQTQNDTSLDIILFDMDITFNKTKFCSLPESCNVSAKLLQIKVESNPESKSATALTEFFPWKTITRRN